MGIISPYSYRSHRGIAGLVGAAQTRSLAHFNGADAATTTVDQVKGTTWAAGGTGQLDTAQAKFGSASGFFPAANDTWTSTLGTAIAEGANFTVECWFRMNTAGVVTVTTTTADLGNAAVATINNDLNTISIVYQDANASEVGSTGSVAVTIADDTWYHFAVSVASNVASAYWNASRIAATTLTGNAAGITGIQLSGTSLADTWVDEQRLSRVARYSGATLTEPTAAFSVGE